jgi:hypothetical protein
MMDIKLRLKSYGTLVLTSLESMRNEYVSTILHTALRIAEEVTKKEFSMKPGYEITGDESCGRVDYAIKVSLPCGTSLPCCLFALASLFSLITNMQMDG